MGDGGCKVVCESLRNNNMVERFNIGANSAGVLSYYRPCSKTSEAVG